LSLPMRMRIHPVFHISMLNKTSNPVTSKNEPIDDAEYEVERILKKRTRQGKVEYQLVLSGANSGIRTSTASEGEEAIEVGTEGKAEE